MCANAHTWAWCACVDQRCKSSVFLSHIYTYFFFFLRQGLWSWHLKPPSSALPRRVSVQEQSPHLAFSVGAGQPNTGLHVCSRSIFFTTEPSLQCLAFFSKIPWMGHKNPCYSWSLFLSWTLCLRPRTIGRLWQLEANIVTDIPIFTLRSMRC